MRDSDAFGCWTTGDKPSRRGVLPPQGRPTDGPIDLTFSCDGLERLTQIRESGGAQQVLKTFTYATANSGADLRQNELLTASRFSYVGAPFNATAKIKDTFVYAGRGGRVSQKDTQMLFNGSPSESFRQSFVWDPAGNLSSLRSESSREILGPCEGIQSL